ncbi:M14 family metallopeptidase [Zavarzinella formosa]|uniref:M14 family metallopeptidase n=1 Tax=Zavarzinella formosa TaxID=360055 RepID=UPI00030B340B|nr:M14 family metallopeptidase [Zavarzinella formosa]
MNHSQAFSPDYATARRRFREAVTRLGWELEAFPIGGVGPNGEELAFDVACSPGGDFANSLVVSGGLHGVEGFFGSAVQLALLDGWANGSKPLPRLNCVLLHGLNPHGFAWLRRFDENNVDPNRNFLLPGELYSGSPAKYPQFNSFLNPERPPSAWEPFTLKALWMIARHGMSAVKQAVAAGQYDFPKGVFYGGAGPSRTNQLLDEHLPRWLKGSREVVHLDFHTGLGRFAECKLLIDYPLTDRQRTRLMDWYGTGSYEDCGPSGISYDARGGFGHWCVSRRFADDYLFACAEFGTYGPIPMFAGVRAENQAHHWGKPNAAGTIRAKKRLRELFSPSSDEWRSRVLKHGIELVDRAVAGLTNDAAKPV